MYKVLILLLSIFFNLNSLNLLLVEGPYENNRILIESYFDLKNELLIGNITPKLYDYLIQSPPTEGPVFLGTINKDYYYVHESWLDPKHKSDIEKFKEENRYNLRIKK